MATTTMNEMGYRLEPEDKTRWGVVRYGRQVVALGLFVMAVAFAFALMAHIGHTLSTVSDQTVYSNVSDFMASAPIILFATALVITLVPATFGLTMIAAMAVIGVLIPFFRDRQQCKENREQRFQHDYSEPHDHIPEGGFELGVH